MPVFDGTDQDRVVIDENRGLDFSKLKPYKGPDLSYGVGLVMYTAHMYNRAGVDRVGFNIQSLVILADM